VSALAGGVLPQLLDSLALSDPWTYLAVFLGVSLLMLWRLEAMLDHGLEGTALGTLLMPYCSGLGNLIFVGIMIHRHGAPGEVLEGQLNRLSLLLTLTAVLFFTGTVWALGGDGKLDRTDGLVLIGLFLFWQCFQVFDVMKHNLRQKVSFGWRFYVDALVVLASAYFMYETIDWLVNWLLAQKGGFVSAANLGWLTGWLMVLPNAVLALYWGWKRRADVVYTSQVGDGHICIPLCLGLFAVVKPLPMAGFTTTALALLVGAAVLHGAFLLINGGLPRWAGGVLIAAYGWFVYAGLLA